MTENLILNTVEMLIYVILIVVGGILLALASANLMNRLAFLRRGVRAVGIVKELIKEKYEDGTFYFPVFEIPGPRQESYTYKHGVGLATPKWQIGDTAMFIFEPGKPERLKPLSYLGIIWGPLLLLAVAVDLLVIGGGYFLYQVCYGM